MDTSELRPTFPHWSEADQDLWVDLLEHFSGALLDPDLSKEELVGKIRTAADLADEAMKEMQYRFYIQRPPRKARATRRRAPDGQKRTRRTK